MGTLHELLLGLIAHRHDEWISDEEALQKLRWSPEQLRLFEDPGGLRAASVQQIDEYMALLETDLLLKIIPKRRKTVAELRAESRFLGRWYKKKKRPLRRR